MHDTTASAGNPLRHVHLGGQQDMSEAGMSSMPNATPTIAQHAPDSQQANDQLVDKSPRQYHASFTGSLTRTSSVT